MCLKNLRTFNHHMYTDFTNTKTKLNSMVLLDTDLSLSQDVAGATFMALATCTPELFTNLIGTFITDSDLGVGTVVGSAVFNTLGVPACGGLTASIVSTLHTFILPLIMCFLASIIETFYSFQLHNYISIHMFYTMNTSPRSAISSFGKRSN